MSVLLPQGDGIPTPKPTAVSQPFWDGCDRGELLYQACAGCGAAQFPPARRCRTCGEEQLAWRASAGTGTVYSWSVVWRPQTPAFAVPYVPCIVAVDEGYHMVSSVIGCAPEEIRLGLPVRFSFHRSDGIALPYACAIGDPDRIDTPRETGSP